MRHLTYALVGAILAISVTSCNSVGALTPPENIGTAGQQSAAAPLDPQADVNPTTPAQATTQPVGVQQADAQYPAAPAADQQQTAMAEPQQNNGPRSPMLGAAGGISATQKSIYQSASQPAAGSVRFLPIIGAPLAAVTPLSQALATEARNHGLVIKPSGDASADYMLKGYFSAFQDGANTSVTYVWDILDGSGARLNRIEGQETVSGNTSDPWASVPADTMRKIAGETITRYLEWKNSHQS